MNLNEIALLRLANQQIAASSFNNVRDIVQWMGAMQAQDYNMSKWAVGVRTHGLSDQSVDSALSKGEIIRTHVLRPTWHLVSAADIHWMLELTAHHIKASMKGRHKALGLTDSILKKCKTIVEKALAKGEHLTRDEIVGKLEKAKIATNENRASHILFMCELDGIIVNGTMIGKKQTYALLDERVKNRTRINNDEALAELTKRYFTSHGPATIRDFIWWSGLPAVKAKSGLEILKSELTFERINDQAYWFFKSADFGEAETKGKHEHESVYLLPAFDEFMISYADRSASLPNIHNSKAISNNGIFKPIIVVNGTITGIWKRAIGKNKMVIEASFFKPPSKKVRSLLEKEADRFGKFLNLETELVIQTH